VIVLDTSALMAILLREPQGAACSVALSAADELAMSAGTLAEALVVADRRGIGTEMRALLAVFPIEVCPVDAVFAQRVADSYTNWGKGAHRASLDLADCFAYALAADRGAPLLFVGNDFSRTDITSVLTQPH
jgi:ribonuclease VapC